MHSTLLHFGHLVLPTFGVLAAVGLMLGLALSQRTALLTGLAPDALWDAGLFAVIAAFVLSRLLLVAANLRSFLAVPLLLLALPSLTATGLLLTAIATLIWLKRKHLAIVSTLDAWSPSAMLVWSFLALGHFAEGSDPGLPTTLPWGSRMPGESTPLHPIALYAALLAAALTVFLYTHLRRSRTTGATAALALGSAGLVQFLLSFLRQPGEAVAGLDLLQWVALGMIAAGAILYLLASPAPPQSDGVFSAVPPR